MTFNAEKVTGLDVSRPACFLSHPPMDCAALFSSVFSGVRFKNQEFFNDTLRAFELVIFFNLIFLENRHSLP